MELILWRHAEAEDGFPDAARKLTDRGLDQAQKMAKWLNSRLPADTLVIASPALRTQQTAMALGCDFVTHDEIAPGASADSILAAADWPYAQGAVIVVGHQPTLGEVANLLIPHVPEGLGFKKGAVWWFSSQDKENPSGPKLQAVIYPEMV